MKGKPNFQKGGKLERKLEYGRSMILKGAVEMTTDGNLQMDGYIHERRAR